MSVTCAAGYVWSSAPTSGVHNATCSDVSNSIQWVFSGSCVGALCVKGHVTHEKFFGKLLAQVTFQIKKVTFPIRKVLAKTTFPNEKVACRMKTMGRE